MKSFCTFVTIRWKDRYQVQCRNLWISYSFC